MGSRWTYAKVDFPAPPMVKVLALALLLQLGESHSRHPEHHSNGWRPSCQSRNFPDVRSGFIAPAIAYCRKAMYRRNWYIQRGKHTSLCIQAPSRSRQRQSPIALRRRATILEREIWTLDCWPVGWDFQSRRGKTVMRSLQLCRVFSKSSLVLPLSC